MVAPRRCVMIEVYDRPGKVDPLAGPEGKGTILLTDDPLWPWPEEGWVLSNFNIDGNVLKDEHKAFLERFVLPFLRREKVHVKLEGYTSRTGDPKANEQLSV